MQGLLQARDVSVLVWAGRRGWLGLFASMSQSSTSEFPPLYVLPSKPGALLGLSHSFGVIWLLLPIVALPL